MVVCFSCEGLGRGIGSDRRWSRRDVPCRRRGRGVVGLRLVVSEEGVIRRREILEGSDGVKYWFGSYLDAAGGIPVGGDVVERMEKFYRRSNADGSGGVCAGTLAKDAFMEYEMARETVGVFVGARDTEEIVFTGSASEAFNIVANSWGLKHLKKGDEILLSVMEHHDNLVPWQMVAKKTGATLKFLAVSSKGNIDFKEVAKQINFRTKILAITHVSHVTGCINDVKSMIDYAKCVNVKVSLAPFSSHSPEAKTNLVSPLILKQQSFRKTHKATPPPPVRPKPQQTDENQNPYQSLRSSCCSLFKNTEDEKLKTPQIPLAIQQPTRSPSFYLSLRGFRDSFIVVFVGRRRMFVCP